MFKVEYMEIHNFRGRSKIELSFSSGQVTILHGRNGAGKTTLLKILHALLSLNEALLASEEIKNAIVVFKDTKSESRVFLQVEKNEENTEYEWKSDANDFYGFVESLSSIVFGVNRGISSNQTHVSITTADIHRVLARNNMRLEENEENRFRRRGLGSLFEELATEINEVLRLKSRRMKRLKMDFNQEGEKHLMLESVSMDYVEASLHERYRFEKKAITSRVQKALFETLALLLDDSTKSKAFPEKDKALFLSKLNSYKYTLLEVLGQLDENDVIIKIKTILSNFSHDEDRPFNPFEGKDLLFQLVSNMITELELGEGLLNTVTLIDEFNSYLPNDKELVIDENGVYVKTRTNNHDIEKLSSGEKHLLSFLTLFVINGRDRKIWMIDEPEISLHLDWQSKLINVLSKFVPDAQIIVATHSPGIAEYGTNNLVELPYEYS